MVNKNLLLSELRKRGYNQSSFAESIGYNKNTFNSKVNGKSPFDTSEVKEICEFLGIKDDKLKVLIFLS